MGLRLGFDPVGQVEEQRGEASLGDLGRARGVKVRKR